jgi:hypothetical protein
MAYDNTNRGALFRNNKREADTDADYKGTVNIEGTEYWIKAATAPWAYEPSIMSYLD